eukprot:CAMPEP_0167779314 /NCGR_PEP_ID=MMETSP0111_2-20121227/4740_1 /TAXON_ID=91324 /ORGANISM="Lotharella globosa, Strain CCCM811" /LENGTH=207 /DNA_ID=CAMNT_0007669715 /DNA_START=109 /DNA_END=732 /DNA_ORIENTATION=+
MALKRSLLALSVVLLGLAIGWPYIEDYIKAQTQGCPVFIDTAANPATTAATTATTATTTASTNDDGSSVQKPRDGEAGTQSGQPDAAADADVDADTEASSEELIHLTEAELRKYDGSGVEGKSSSIYLSIGGGIYDVTNGKSYYGADGSYSIFAGRVCDRALALSKLEDGELNDNLEGLTEEHMGTYAHWKGFFAKKYPKIGLLTKD